MSMERLSLLSEQRQRPCNSRRFTSRPALHHRRPVFELPITIVSAPESPTNEHRLPSLVSRSHSTGVRPAFSLHPSSTLPRKPPESTLLVARCRPVLPPNMSSSCRRAHGLGGLPPLPRPTNAGSGVCLAGWPDHPRRAVTRMGSGLSPPTLDTGRENSTGVHGASSWRHDGCSLELRPGSFQIETVPIVKVLLQRMILFEKPATFRDQALGSTRARPVVRAPGRGAADRLFGLYRGNDGSPRH